MNWKKLIETLKELNKDAPVFRAQKYLNTKEKKFVFVFLSSRTKDDVTLEATKRLFQRYGTFENIVKAPEEELMELIKPVAFYRQKAKNLKKIKEIPETLEKLLKLPGVGIKIAKVFLASLGKPYIGVDTHVHRIVNRLGLVKTKTPEETDRVLEKIVPKEVKKELNIVLVAHGQVTCTPRNPRCDRCPLKSHCLYGKG